MDLIDYQVKAKSADKIPWGKSFGHHIPMLGALGELGSFASVLKKKGRDEGACSTFRSDVKEELGDLLWYLVVMADRLGVKLESSYSKLEGGDIYQLIYSVSKMISELTFKASCLRVPESDDRDEVCVQLIDSILNKISEICLFFDLSLEDVAESNWKKIQDFWIPQEQSSAKCFDLEFEIHERLPRKFVVDFVQIENGSALIMYINGLRFGDRLTDNAHQKDGYRFHDIFHLANVAFLGWSPVFRQLFNCKRKSKDKFDEVEDGARAAIIEEAVINHIYDYARDRDFLNNFKTVDFDILKRILNLVSGYEVESCKAWEWKMSILESYTIFRRFINLPKNHSARIKVNADKRTIDFEDLGVGCIPKGVKSFF